MSFFQNLGDSTGEAFLVYVNEVLLNLYILLTVFPVCLHRKWAPHFCWKFSMWSFNVVSDSRNIGLTQKISLKLNGQLDKVKKRMNV